MARCITVLEAANRLGLAVATVRRMLGDGTLRRVYVTPKHGAVRILEDDVEALIAKGLVSSENKAVQR